MIHVVVVVNCLELSTKGWGEVRCCWVGEIKNESWVVKVSVEDQQKIWKEHMEKLMNVENEWSDSIDARGCSEEN